MDTFEINKLIEDNTKLIWAVLNRNFTSRSNDPLLYQAGLVGLWKAAKTFDISRGVPFANYACICITNYIRIELTEERHKRNYINTNASPLDDSYEQPIGTPESILDNIVIRDYIKKLNPKHRHIIFLFAFKGKSIRDIAKEMNYSRAYVGHVIQRIREDIIEALKGGS